MSELFDRFRLLRRVRIEHLGATTPEPKRGSPKAHFPLTAVVFKSGNRFLSWFCMNVPPPTLWRGRTLTYRGTSRKRTTPPLKLLDRFSLLRRVRIEHLDRRPMRDS
jgi:hypothetical protein